MPLDLTDRRMLEILQRDGRISNAALVEQQVDGHSDSTAAAISEKLLVAPEVISAHIVSGAADFRLEVVVQDLAAYERLMFDTLLTLPNIGDVRSNFALRTVKAPAPLPV